MTIKDILNLDYRDLHQKGIICSKLENIPYFSKIRGSGKVILLTNIETFVHKVCRKYSILLKLHNNPLVNKSYDVWHCDLISGFTSEIIIKIYGMCIDEVFAKMAIFLYAYIRKKGD